MKRIFFLLLLALSGAWLLQSVVLMSGPAHAAPAIWYAQAGTGQAAAAQAAPAAQTEASRKLHGAPYVTDVTQNSAVVNWVVRVGPIAVGETPEQLAVSAHGWRVERAALGGLKPNTVYFYDVLKDGTTEGRGQFKTAPPPSAAQSSYSFVVYGDTRTRHEVHKQVAARISGEQYDFVLHTGDLVADGMRAEQWPIFFESSGPVLRKAAFFPSLGNHERNTPFFYQFFPRRFSYFSFRWGNAFIAVLNSDAGNFAPSAESRERFWTEQLEWLDRELRSASAVDFRFVAMHHTPYTAVQARQKAAAELLERLGPVLRRNGVNAVFSGHDHNYQRHVADGIQFVVTGGGGAPLYENNAPIEGITVKAEKIENFVRGRVQGREATFQAIAIDGRVIEEFAITGGPAVPPATATPSAAPAGRQ